jgi:hypothetical protein
LKVQGFGSRTRRRPKRVGLCRGKHAECGMKSEKGQKVKGLEVGPVVVPKRWDYAAASMRNSERNRKEQSAEGKA